MKRIARNGPALSAGAVYVGAKNLLVQHLSRRRPRGCPARVCYRPATLKSASSTPAVIGEASAGAISESAVTPCLSKSAAASACESASTPPGNDKPCSPPCVIAPAGVLDGNGAVPPGVRPT